MTLRNTGASLLAFVTCLYLATVVAFGQSSQTLPTIIAPSIIRIQTGGDTSMQIAVSPGSVPSKQLMVLIRGLPSTMALSAGRLFDSGIWGIRPPDLPTLKITVAADAEGQIPISLSLVTLTGDTLAEASMTLVFAPSAAASAAAGNQENGKKGERASAAPAEPSPQTAEANSEQAPKPKQFSDEEIEQMLLLMKRGAENMATGRVNIAQMFYRRAAENGWAPAALALGKTYDPAGLSAVVVIGGVAADKKLAKFWYERARDLGSREAAELLQQNGKN